MIALRNHVIIACVYHYHQNLFAGSYTCVRTSHTWHRYFFLEITAGLHNDFGGGGSHLNMSQYVAKHFPVYVASVIDNTIAAIPTDLRNLNRVFLINVLINLSFLLEYLAAKTTSVLIPSYSNSVLVQAGVYIVVRCN